MLHIKSHKLACALLGAAFAATALLAPQALHAQSITNPHARGSSSKVLVQGPVSTPTGTAAGTFSGVLNVTSFAVQNGQIVANALLTGTITNLDGTTSQVSQTVSTLVTGADPSCSILNLTLGPLHLNVLGLVIDLNQVNLNITAVPGAGNLLGNLLCDVAGLLNGTGSPLSAIVSDLNMILKNL
ncbi:MAG TPA: hypothetical protein VKB38_01000 [Terracidiphilus sp.]|nr:hypothetical protein [Terracidiphilus sp.]